MTSSLVIGGEQQLDRMAFSAEPGGEGSQSLKILESLIESHESLGGTEEGAER
jgi:hypothetical protein